MNIEKSYLENNIFTKKEKEDDDTHPQVGGAYPINSLFFNNYQKQFENYGVPIGLVVKPVNPTILGGGSSIYKSINNNIPTLIEEDQFDNIYNRIHIKIPFYTNKTRKNRK